MAHPEDLKLKVSKAFLDLLQAFDAAEQAHHRAHHLTGSKKDMKVGSEV
jgi:hypothetical protein